MRCRAPWRSSWSTLGVARRACREVERRESEGRMSSGEGASPTLSRRSMNGTALQVDSVIPALPTPASHSASTARPCSTGGCVSSPSRFLCNHTRTHLSCTEKSSPTSSSSHESSHKLSSPALPVPFSVAAPLSREAAKVSLSSQSVLPRRARCERVQNDSVTAAAARNEVEAHLRWGTLRTRRPPRVAAAEGAPSWLVQR